MEQAQRHEGGLIDNITKLKEEIIEFLADYNQSKRNIEQMFDELNGRERDWVRREDQFAEEIAELHHDVAELEKMRVQLHQ